MHIIFAELSLSCLKMYGRKKQKLEDVERKQSQGKTEMSSTIGCPEKNFFFNFAYSS